MPELPTGTVTFLFTDIEGSTRVLHELGDSYAGVLAEHRRVLRDAFARHGGVEVDTQGDAFFVAFARASDAVAAAEEAQSALRDGPVSVRIGIHTGEPMVTEEGYVGMDVHRAARVMSAGYGGQVLVSEATRRLVDDSRPLRDLGPQRLKDMTAPEHIYQLGDTDFPPLKTLNQTNLPVAASPLVGREDELGELLALLEDGYRVVSVTGAGGSGKTRLALQAAAESVERFEHGVFWVPLAGLGDPQLVLPAVAQTLGVRDDLAAHLADRHALILLDNFEHLLDAAGEVSRLLAAAPNVKALVTSRSSLRIDGEREYPLDPLRDAEAVTLFLERARAAGRTLVPDATVAEICERLDRLPLAIELAAARVKLLAPAALLERLEQRLPLLTGGRRDAPERHRTLRATIAWSYELLADEPRRLFARLSVFAGSFSLEAAEEICQADLDALGALVELSLLKPVGDDRLLMLETISEYAGERLDEVGDGDAIRRRHAEFFLALAESANLTATSDGEMDHDSVSREQDNLRAALDWALAREELEVGLRLAIAAESFWSTASPMEGYRRVSAFLEQGRGRISGKLLADALRTCASTIYIVGEYERGTRYIEQSLDEYRRVGDERGIGHMLLRLAVEANRVGDRDRARALALESVESARRVGFRRGEPLALGVLATLECAENRPERGMELLERGAALAREIGFTWWEAVILSDLAFYALELGRAENAARWAAQALVLARRMGDRQRLVQGVALRAQAAAAAGDRELAGHLWGAIEAEEARGRVGQWEDYRDEFAVEFLSEASEEFERGREAGRQLTLDEAVEYALGGGDA
ncbi:MAG: adenylate/guanylate cyclase domain-containing protein [Actinobacteria bacterium]|nr:adenylate/guanylate cyclase domain-containing protein [Actinomycetota bacterium]